MLSFRFAVCASWVAAVHVTDALLTVDDEVRTSKQCRSDASTTKQHQAFDQEHILLQFERGWRVNGAGSHMKLSHGSTHKKHVSAYNASVSGENTCCSNCAGKSFCSPHSWNCYDAKLKDYYRGCTEGEPSQAPDTPCANNVSSSQISRRRRVSDMCSCRRRSSRVEEGWACQNDLVVAAEELPATELANPYVNNYEGLNPLGIESVSKREDNYVLILGDWGKAFAPGDCQLKVAEKMKRYVSEQRKLGKNLLAVLTVGDNFYWTGATESSWAVQWEPVYGTNDPESPLFGVPWLACLGNHDLGDNDPYAFCPHVSPLAMVNGQAYGSQQFNKDRNPLRPDGTDKYYMPDYNYHYEIPELSLEFIFVDTNHKYTAHMLHSAGFHGAREMCGGKHEVVNFLATIEQSGEELLKRRAKEGTAKTTIILQHYPEKGWHTRKIFEESLEEGRTVNVLSAYGHAHDQVCTYAGADGNCEMVLTGGGGGCCMDGWAGFTAVHLDAEGGFITDIESDKVRLPKWSCSV